jgi:hypothetical protein
MQQHIRNHGAIVSRIIINVSCKDCMLDPLQCSAMSSWYAWPWACTAAVAVTMTVCCADFGSAPGAVMLLQWLALPCLVLCYHVTLCSCTQ